MSIAWQQPVMVEPVPAAVINGRAFEATVRSFSASIEEAGVYVETSGGQHVPHVLLQSAAAPVATPWEGELDVSLDSEETAAEIQRAALLASIGELSIWLDVWALELSLGTGARTTFALARKTGYGSTGVSWADRPARCWVGGVEQTMVVGTPSAGQCQLSQTADSTSFKLGAAPGAGVIVEMRYYPVRIASASWGIEIPDFNGGEATLELVEKIEARAYES